MKEIDRAVKEEVAVGMVELQLFPPSMCKNLRAVEPVSINALSLISFIDSQIVRGSTLGNEGTIGDRVIHLRFRGELSVLVEGKILGSRHRHANDTNLHEKTWPRTTNLHENVSLAVLKLSRRSMKTDCENQ
ncbi:hypothetical protein J6590_044682 [Homalodisca vitripennis]|nr:hypothetical protein J6590_044682 [Homalodisca vitripennis]